MEMIPVREIEELPSGSSSEHAGSESEGTTRTESCAHNSRIRRYTIRELVADTDNNVFPESFLVSSDIAGNNIQIFTFGELSVATNNFDKDTIVGRGAFGNVHKGTLGTGQVVAVKRMKRRGFHGEPEFKNEILMLSLLHHPNLINLIGYCVQGSERILVYEFMQTGSLEKNLHDLPSEPLLDWNKRMKIAAGLAKAMEYLHHTMDPPVYFRDLKSSNILLDEEYNPKLSDFGVAKFNPVSQEQKEKLESDIRSFGLVLLELVSGRKQDDPTRDEDQQLITWALPLFKYRWMFPQMVDPKIRHDYSMYGLAQVLDMASMCIQCKADERPTISRMVNELSGLVSNPQVVPGDNDDQTVKTCPGCVSL